MTLKKLPPLDAVQKVRFFNRLKDLRQCVVVGIVLGMGLFKSFSDMDDRPGSQVFEKQIAGAREADIGVYVGQADGLVSGQVFNGGKVGSFGVKWAFQNVAGANGVVVGKSEINDSVWFKCQNQSGAGCYKDSNLHGENKSKSSMKGQSKFVAPRNELMV